MLMHKLNKSVFKPIFKWLRICRYKNWFGGFYHRTIMVIKRESKSKVESSLNRDGDDYEDEIVNLERGETNRRGRRRRSQEAEIDDDDSGSSMFGSLLKLVFFSSLVLLAYLALYPTDNYFDINYKDPDVKAKLLSRLEKGNEFLMEKIGEGRTFLNAKFSEVMGAKGSADSEEVIADDPESNLNEEDFVDCPDAAAKAEVLARALEFKKTRKGKLTSGKRKVEKEIDESSD